MERINKLRVASDLQEIGDPHKLTVGRILWVLLVNPIEIVFLFMIIIKVLNFDMIYIALTWEWIYAILLSVMTLILPIVMWGLSRSGEDNDGEVLVYNTMYVGLFYATIPSVASTWNSLTQMAIYVLLLYSGFVNQSVGLMAIFLLYYFVLTVMRDVMSDKLGYILAEIDRAGCKQIG